MAKDFKERIITVNLRRAFEKPLTKRAIASKFALKESVKKETRLAKQLISNKLNEKLWAQGKYNALRSITVKVVKDKDTARIMLPEEKFEEKKAVKKETKPESAKDSAKETAKPTTKTETKTAKKE